VRKLIRYQIAIVIQAEEEEEEEEKEEEPNQSILIRYPLCCYRNKTALRL